MVSSRIIILSHVFISALETQAAIFRSDLVSAQILVGGWQRSIALQPLSVEGQVSANLALGVADLTLRQSHALIGSSFNPDQLGRVRTHEMRLVMNG
jgi:uncharacterized protein DUF992